MKRLLVVLVVLLSSAVLAGGGGAPYRHYILGNAGGECISTGDSVISTASASPPAIQTAATTTQSFLTAPAANTCIVGVHGAFGAAAIDNLIQRSSFETWAGGDPTGWVAGSADGDGSAATTEETSNVADGSSSVLITMTGTTSVARWSGACITDGIGGDLYLSGWAEKQTGTSQSTMVIVEFDNANCSSFLQNNVAVANKDIESTWTKQGGLIAAASWHADTSSYYVRITETCNGGCSVVWDAFQARAASTAIPAFCGADTDATASCTADLASINNPLSKAGAWTIRVKVQSPIDGAVATPARIILHADGTGGGNENRLDITWASDVLTCDLYDASGTKKTSTVAAAGSAGTEYTVTMYKRLNGNVGCCWDGTCDASEATLALTDDRAADLDVACDGTNPGWVWVSDLEFFRRLVIP
jgi:hypothetical protein